MLSEHFNTMSHNASMIRPSTNNISSLETESIVHRKSKIVKNNEINSEEKTLFVGKESTTILKSGTMASKFRVSHNKAKVAEMDGNRTRDGISAAIFCLKRSEILVFEFTDDSWPNFRFTHLINFSL